MGDGQYGPSWQDCAQAAGYIWERYGYRADIRLVQSVRRFDGKGNSAWQVAVRCEPREGKGEAPAFATESFGQGGTCKTASAALLLSLSAVVEILDARERAAAKQAAF